MKKFVLTVTGLLLAGCLVASDLPWLTSLPEALNEARAQNKTVLMDFTGSDWCGWCKKLDAETFSSGAFAEYAAAHLVLVQVDFPRAEPQSDDLRAANAALKEKYGIRGFPTLIQLGPDGSEMWRQVGYAPGGPAFLISKLGGSAAKTASAPPASAAINYGGTPIPEKPDGEPRLQGIFWSHGHGSILLGGKTCEEGDVVRGMSVLKITRNKVTVEWKGKTKDLTL